VNNTRTFTIFACENYAPDFRKVTEKEEFGHVSFIEFPCMCSGKNQCDAVKYLLSESKDKGDSGVIFCGRGCGILKLLPNDLDFKTRVSEYCCSYLAPHYVIQSLLDRGGYVIGVGWLQNWRERIRQMGFDRDTARSFLGESYRELVYFETDSSSEGRSLLQELSNFLKLPYHIEHTDLDVLGLTIKNEDSEWKLRNTRSEAKAVVSEAQSKAAEYASILDLLGKLGMHDNKPEALEGIKEIFTIIMGATVFSFYGSTDEATALPPAIKRLFEEGNLQYQLDEKNGKFYVPVRHKEETHGVIEAGGFLFPEYLIRYLNFATGVSRLFGLILTNIERYEAINNLSLTDALTGVANRRLLMRKIEEEIERRKRMERQFSVILLDIDHFKRVNDQFGHNAGDNVLKYMAQHIKDRIRKIDCISRWGGEEFVILLPDTPIQNAVKLAEELRESISLLVIPDVGSITASFGVAAYQNGDTMDTLISKADHQMYLAKESGRNRVCVENNEKK
jgi:diguanylate cyclase (GGDEF)-like protein